jgi:hypothetical protein
VTECTQAAASPVHKVHCPACGEVQGVWITYGLVSGMPSTDSVNGGCIMKSGKPARACLECGHRWGQLVIDRNPDGNRTIRWTD